MVIEQNHVLELTFAGRTHLDDPFNTVDLSVDFTAPNGRTLRVPAFWSGGDVWKVRYSSAIVGVHSCRTDCTCCRSTVDAGLEQSGNITVTPCTGDNPLYRHGAVNRRNDDLYLTHQDGEPFFWFADTWRMGLTTRLAWPEDFQVLLSDRVAKGFSVVQVIAGLYPDMLPFDEQGRNEAGFLWDESIHRTNPAYFDMADRRIACLVDSRHHALHRRKLGIFHEIRRQNCPDASLAQPDRVVGGLSGSLVRGGGGQYGFL